MDLTLQLQRVKLINQKINDIAAEHDFVHTSPLDHKPPAWINRLQYNPSTNVAAKSSRKWTFKGNVLHSFKEHTGSIRSVAVHDCERYFISGARDCTVKCWAIDREHARRTYYGHRHPVFEVKFVDWDYKVASCDGTVHVWDFEVGKCVLQLEDEASYGSLDSLNDRAMLTMGTNNGVVTLRDVRGNSTNAIEWRLPQAQSGPIKAITTVPDMSMIAIGQSQGYITLVDYRYGILMNSWRAHDGQILNLKSHKMNGSNYLVSSSTDRLLALWNVSKSPACFEKTFKGHRDPIQSFTIYSDGFSNELLSVAGHKIAVASMDTAQQDVKLQRMRFQKSSLKPNQLTTVNALPFHHLMLISSEDGQIKVAS